MKQQVYERGLQVLLSPWIRNVRLLYSLSLGEEFIGMTAVHSSHFFHLYITFAVFEIQPNPHIGDC